MNCYFDGSVGGVSDQWLTLGGLVATDATWATFQTQWETMLRNRDPVAPYMHMTDIVTQNGAFKSNFGWTRNKINQLVNDAEYVLHLAPKNTLCASACSIDTKARIRLLAEGYRIPKPAVLCAEIGLKHLLAWYVNTHKIELAHLFYDQNELFIRSIRTRWLRLNNPKRVTSDLFWGSIANVQPLDMRTTPALQAADMVAWAFTRRLRNVAGDKWRTLANNLIGTRTYPGLLTATQTEPIDEAMMRRKYAKRGP